VAALYQAQSMADTYGRSVNQDKLHEIYMQAYEKITDKGGLSAAFHETYINDGGMFELSLPSFVPEPEAPEPDLSVSQEPQMQINSPQPQIPNPFSIKPPGMF